MATDFKGYLLEEFLEDYQEGLITRREAAKLIGGIVGSLALADVLLAACSPAAGNGSSPTVVPAASEGTGTRPTAGASAPEVLVDAAQVDKVLRERKHRAMFFIDIGDRQNFDPRINEIDNVYLYNIDDLEAVAKENLQGRAGEVRKAEEIGDEEVGGFLRWVGSLDHVPTIVALRQRLEEIRQAELEKSLRSSLKELSEKEKQAIEDMTAAIINKILHAPISRLKRPPDDEDEAIYVEALRKLFGLGEK